MIDVSILIVNYNTKELIIDCINSIYKFTKDVSFEIIVSDNGSKDDSIKAISEKFPKVKLIDNGVNLGFGAANNRAVKIARGKYIFYLNSDTILLNNAIKYFFDYWESHKDDNLGALGANLLDRNGRIIHSWGCFPTLPQTTKRLLRRFLAQTFKGIKERIFKKNSLYSVQTEPHYVGKVDYVTGADLFLLNNDDAYFDERYFLYYEETDLEYKLALKNKSRMIIDGPKIMHLLGGSENNDRITVLDQYASFSKIQMDISCLRFFAYHRDKKQAKFIKLLIKLCWFHPTVCRNTREYCCYLDSII